MNRILLIDDNAEIQAANSEYLEGKGYEVDTAMDGVQALSLMRSKKYDCVVLDVMLPDLDGYTVCSLARKGEEKTPIIFLSCLDSEDNRIKGLMAGGDDYMTKPYSIREMLARINAQIRRNKVFDHMDEGVQSPRPSVMYDNETRVIAIRGINILMSRKEYDIITKLVARAGELVPKEELMALVSGEESTLFTCIKRIRSKLDMDPVLGKIETVFGEGYKYFPAKDDGGKL